MRKAESESSHTTLSKRLTKTTKRKKAESESESESSHTTFSESESGSSVTTLSCESYDDNAAASSEASLSTSFLKKVKKEEEKKEAKKSGVKHAKKRKTVTKKKTSEKSKTKKKKITKNKKITKKIMKKKKQERKTNKSKLEQLLPSPYLVRGMDNTLVALVKKIHLETTCAFRCDNGVNGLITKPVMLKCGHFFCSPCIKTMMCFRARRCPLCRAKITVRADELVSSQQLTNLVNFTAQLVNFVDGLL